MIQKTEKILKYLQNNLDHTVTAAIVAILKVSLVELTVRVTNKLLLSRVAYVHNIPRAP